MISNRNILRFSNQSPYDYVVIFCLPDGQLNGARYFSSITSLSFVIYIRICLRNLFVINFNSNVQLLKDQTRTQTPFYRCVSIESKLECYHFGIVRTDMLWYECLSNKRWCAAVDASHRIRPTRKSMRNPFIEHTFASTFFSRVT